MELATTTERKINLSKRPCDWCWSPATWDVIDEWAYQGHQYACTVHGTEWFPELFPESETASIEALVAEILTRPQPVSLVKRGATYGHGRALQAPTEWDLEKRRAQSTLRPWYPLMAHRDGLRRNDLVTLGSALFVLALEGGTAHKVSSDPDSGIWY